MQSGDGLPLWAQEPSISSTTPLAVQPGKATDVKLRGGNLAGASELWISSPGHAQLSANVKDNGKNKAEATYRIEVPADTPVGVYGLRLAAPGGTSALRLFAVDDLPSVAQSKDNTTPAAAQELAIPGAVDGSLSSLTRNYYKFKVAAGQQVSFEVLARRLGSALDPMIRILDSKGRELAYSDDVPGLRADAQLCHDFEQEGEYVLEIRDIRYQGGGNHFYRLRIGDFPCVLVPYPMGVKRGSRATITFAGTHTQGVQPVKLNVPADLAFQWLHVGAKRASGKSSGFVTLAIGDSDEFLESEPNDESDNANRIEMGTNINGRLDKPNDVDRFVFKAEKGQRITFRGITRRQGAPTSLYMRLLKADGAQVAVKEDFGTADAVLDYHFKAEGGDYTLVLEDMHRRGGTQFAYRIVLGLAKTGFTLAASADRVNIPAGGTAMVTVTATRQRYTGPISVGAVNLPDGITSTSAVIGSGQTSVVLTLSSQPGAPTGKVFPIQILGTAEIANQDFRAVASISGALKATFNGLPWPPNSLSEAVAVGVGPEKAIRLNIESQQITFGRDLKAVVKVTAEREKGWDDQIALAVTPAKNGLPGGVTAALKPIPKGKNEIEITFSANSKAPQGDFTAVLTGTIKNGKTTITEAVPGIGLRLQAPLTIKPTAENLKLTKGGQFKLKVIVERNPALKAPIVVSFQNLPKGVAATKATIAADKNEAEIVFTATPDAQSGTVKNVTVKGDATIGKAKFSATSAAFSLAVE